MAKTKVQKQEMLKGYTESLKDSMGVIVLSQSGLKPADVNQFKQSLAEVDATYTVVKNTIFNIALKETELPEMDVFSAGPNSVVFTSDDVASAAKVVADFVKKFKDNIEIKAGLLEGQQLTLDQVKELSELPTKEQSVAMIAGILQQNIAGVANVLQDSVQSIAIILDKAFQQE